MIVRDNPVTDDNRVPVSLPGGGGPGPGEGGVVFDAPADGVLYGRKDEAWSPAAPLVSGLVPAENLPSYVDDVIEVANFAALPATGESGKIYVTLNNSWCYRWSGSIYVKIGQPISNSDDVPEGSTNLYFTVARQALYYTKTEADAKYQTIAGMSSYLTTSNASTTYQTIAGMSGYVTNGALSTALGGYYTKSESDAKYQTIAGMSSYLTTATAASTYLTIANAASTYQTLAGMSSYLTTASAASTYQTQAGMSNYSTTTQMNTAISNALSGYLTAATAASTYQTIAGMSSYLTTATAAATYLTIANAAATYAPISTTYTKTQIDQQHTEFTSVRFAAGSEGASIHVAFGEHVVIPLAGNLTALTVVCPTSTGLTANDVGRKFSFQVVGFNVATLTLKSETNDVFFAESYTYLGNTKPQIIRFVFWQLSPPDFAHC